MVVPNPPRAANDNAVDPVELASTLEESVPTIPDELTQYVLRSNGVETEDAGMVRMVSFAAQQFLSQVIHDSQQFAKKRHVEEGKARQKDGAQVVTRDQVLTSADLGAALRDYGVSHKVPPYFLDQHGRGNV